MCIEICILSSVCNKRTTSSQYVSIKTQSEKHIDFERCHVLSMCGGGISFCEIPRHKTDACVEEVHRREPRRNPNNGKRSMTTMVIHITVTKHTAPSSDKGTTLVQGWTTATVCHYLLPRLNHQRFRLEWVNQRSQ